MTPGMIRTVLGDITPPTGPILAHEHLQIDLSHNKGLDNVMREAEAAAVAFDLRETKAAHGLALVADMSVPGSGRNPVVLRDLSRGSGVSVVCATGFYWEPFPALVNAVSRAELAAIMVGEIETGIGETGIRCGVIKVGTAPGAPDAAAEALFRAAVDAAKATGAAIVTHTSHAEQAFWQLDLLRDEGMDLSRVVISHLHKLQDFADLRRVLETGVFVGFDQLGFKKGPPIAQIADWAMQILVLGHGHQLLLSADIARKSRLLAHGGVGYATTFTEFLPLLRARGASEAQIDQLMVAGPARMLALRPV